MASAISGFQCRCPPAAAGADSPAEPSDSSGRRYPSGHPCNPEPHKGPEPEQTHCLSLNPEKEPETEAEWKQTFLWISEVCSSPSWTLAGLSGWSSVAPPELVAQVAQPELVAEYAPPEVVAEDAQPELVAEDAPPELVAEDGPPELVAEDAQPEPVAAPTLSEERVVLAE